MLIFRTSEFPSPKARMSEATTLTALFESLDAVGEGERLSIGEVLRVIGARGYGPLVLVLALCPPSVRSTSTPSRRRAMSSSCTRSWATTSSMMRTARAGPALE